MPSVPTHSISSSHTLQQRQPISGSHQSFDDPRINEAKRTATEILTHDQLGHVRFVCYGVTCSGDHVGEFIQNIAVRVSPPLQQLFGQAVAYPPIIRSGDLPAVRQERLKIAERILGIDLREHGITWDRVNLVLGQAADQGLPLIGSVSRE